MSDDLVTRLRDGKLTWGDRWEAAARIEADAATIERLTAERDSASGLALTLQSECERLHGDVAAAEAKLAALVEAAQGMSTPIKNVDFETRLEQHGRLFAAVTAAKGAK